MLHEKVTIESYDGKSHQDLLINFVFSFGKYPRGRFLRSVGLEHRKPVISRLTNYLEQALSAYNYTGIVEPVILYVIKDMHGKVVDPKYVIELLESTRRYEKLIFPPHLRHFGQSSVGRKRRYSRCLRRPKTTSEKRLAVQVEEFEPTIRGPRSVKGLPCAWDDVPRDIERNWKSQRKTRHQYK